ncbi:MAG TPA: hypothetical protein VFX43_20410 [Chitinophagaceae bacterium]|jgi:hypothetical protein|nr:hypothetical protein [Chitinophagaceae bacterium]
MKLIRFYLPAMVWTLVILILTLMPAVDIPHPPPFLQIPHLDKLVHGGIFALFVILWYAASYKSFSATYGKTKDTGIRQYHPLTVLAVVILAAVILGLLIEITQKEWTTIHRDFEWFDWLADIIGAFFGGAVANEIFKIKPGSPK